MSNVPGATCELCGATIPPEVMARRRRNAKHYFCNTEHRNAWWKQTGHFKAMSEIGKPARSAAVTQSNHEKPRRKSK